ncbi:hypothetical protein RN51_01719 [Microbacterium oxydans]|uniref:Uncharacterized protein n=1 Tax=Microbacterium oxydans TaxID=82380 RepID=A0A0F0KQ18_9MICO|nr:hypothetical protein [Microbacterium oxydans]KJL22973.1 hypothetical protein RN51_01719 [Microbacterium oxydans]
MTEADESSSEPEVNDWANPTPEEARRLLGKTNDLAALLELHPQLAKVARLGVDAIRATGDAEREATENLASEYYKFTHHNVDELYARLRDPNVSAEEVDRIYDLLGTIEARVAVKDTEHIAARAKIGDKDRKYITLFIGLGLTATVLLLSRGKGIGLR